MSSFTTLVVAEMCSFIPYILFIPLSVYGNVRLYKCKTQLFVQKRNLLIAYGLNFALLFQMVASCIAHFSILYLNKISITISFSIFFLSYWILLYFLNTKNWIIYFNERWTKYALDLKWQQIINPKCLSGNNTRNWFITNRHTYGNIRYILKLFGILHLLGLTLVIAAQCILITSNGHPTAITLSIIMITSTIIPYIIFYVFLVFKTPRFNDIFNIHWESQMHARLVVIMGIGLIAFNMWYAMYFNDNYNKSSLHSIYAMLCFPFVCLILFIMMMISTLLIIKKTEKHHTCTHGNHNRTLKQSKQQSLPSVSKRNSAKISMINRDKKFYSLDLILSNKHSFHLFMVHLSKEFSMECLLAYVELTQFQQYIITQNKDNKKIKQDTINQLKIIIFPPSIPMSGIVENDFKISKFNTLKNNAMEYKLKLNKLFDKYIKVSAAYEINISYQERAAWMGMMSTTSNLWSFMHVNVDLNELLLLIETCKKTLAKLLDHSLYRFKTYAKFAEVQQIEFKFLVIPKEQSMTGQSRLSAVFGQNQNSLSKSKSKSTSNQKDMISDDKLLKQNNKNNVGVFVNIIPQLTVRSQTASIYQSEIENNQNENAVIELD